MKQEGGTPATPPELQALPHAVGSKCVHAPALHESMVQTLPSSQLRVPTGAPVTGEQLPVEAARLHAWQAPVHGPLQHTPSTQNVEVHWVPRMHGVPRPSVGTQLPALQ
jgi:hypothetical protein